MEEFTRKVSRHRADLCYSVLWLPTTEYIRITGSTPYHIMWPLSSTKKYFNICAIIMLRNNGNIDIPPGNCEHLFVHKFYKNIERHTVDTIVSWPSPQQWVIVHTSDLIMIIRQSIYILSIIITEMGKLKTYSPTYCIMDNGENMLNLTHTLDKIYLTGIL